MYLHYQKLTIEIQCIECCYKYLRCQYMREAHRALVNPSKKYNRYILKDTYLERLEPPTLLFIELLTFRTYFPHIFSSLLSYKIDKNDYQDIEFIILLFTQIWASLCAVKKYLHLPRTNIHY